MPIVRVELWKGATKETKAKLAKAITNDVATIANKRPQNILVLFSDYEKENWAIGGELASDIDWSKK
jgi:4-oxalocrotonate tautomerase